MHKRHKRARQLRARPADWLYTWCEMRGILKKIVASCFVVIVGILHGHVFSGTPMNQVWGIGGVYQAVGRPVSV